MGMVGMKDPIKFTDIESQGITIFLGILLIIMTILLNNTLGLLCASIFAVIGILGICLRAWRRSKNALKKEPNQANEIYSYLDVLYNDVGLFVKQYYNSENSYNNQKSKSLHDKMGEFIPLMSRYKLLLSDELVEEITTFFDKLFKYKGKIEGSVSYNRDAIAYERWLKINDEFNKAIVPMFKDIKQSFEAITQPLA